MTKIYITSRKMIRELRVKRGFSVSELAEAADISTKFLYNIETGKAGFSAKVLFDIASALNVSCDFILTGNASNEVGTIVETIKQFDKTDLRYLERILLDIARMRANKG